MALPDEKLERLPGPYEILEIQDGQTVTLRVEAWKLGLMTIHPRDTPGKEKIIKALRVQIPRELKPVGLNYWDITSQTLIAQLEPWLRRPDFKRFRFRITAYGVAPRKRFTVEVR